MFLRWSKCFLALAFLVLSSVSIAVLVAQTLFALPLPFPKMLDWALGTVAVLSLLSAKRISKDGSQDVELRTTAASCADLRSDLQLTPVTVPQLCGLIVSGNVPIWG